MDGNKHGAKSFLHKPAFRIGIVVVVVHAVCWIGWNATNGGASNKNSADLANANHEKIRAALNETK
ncbi:hypothetical protein KR093_004307 [Drosophila rubida]|uniref:Uncharacterized protein n=1 Tax=Drosophila rubida TaxID=30044 RepID=A0AAD4K804_9MUSC|nr:hypothetical protein KR093_004307 [Drosophila rubida]